MERVMHTGVVRRLSASFLILTLWVGTIAAVPSFGQTAQPTAANTGDKKDVKPAPTPSPAPPKAAPLSLKNAPLSAKEDPNQIGKRNINGGTGDKFFGWLGGSQEKEM